VVQVALDLGINFFDTANVYGATPTFDRPGAPPAAEREPAEQILGRALAGRRDNVVIATKSGERRFDPAAGLSRRYIIQQVEHSLRRLGTDYIDLYYAHFPDPDTPLEQTLSVYDDLVRQGKLRYVALSNHPAWQVTHALWIADDRRLAAAPVCVQVKYNLIDRAVEAELAPACLQFGLSIVPFGPLHGGLLAGTSQVEEREFAGDRRFGGSGFTETELEIGRAVERRSQDWSLQPHQVSLAWLLSRPTVASAIVGAETVEEITANATAADVILEQAQLDALTALLAGDDDS
jgi:aryl-alcohol dehydrogenase-like predicted oxidoreductase